MPTEGQTARVELSSRPFGSEATQRREVASTLVYQGQRAGVLARNLAVLRSTQAEIAALVERVVIPDSVTSEMGRDGSSTFVLTDENGRREWLGRSSMPTISAEALYGECSYDGSNVCLPGIMTGVELLVLAERLPVQCAIFVVEPDSLRLHLAMQLYDYSPLIAAGRAVFLDASDLDASLRRFFTDHPGYEIPRTLFTGALRAPAKIAELQRRFESAGEGATQAQAEALVTCAERIRRRSFADVPAAPRTALVSVDQRLDALEQGRRLARGLSTLGAPHAVCLADAAERCHAVAGLRAIDSIQADVVLCVNVGAERWRGLLPQDLPIGAIMLGVEAVPKAVIGALSPRDLVFAASREVEQAAIENGLPPERCRRFDPAVDDVCLPQLEEHPSNSASREFEATIVADVPDDRAEPNGVTLSSHVALWNSLVALAGRTVDRTNLCSPAELLRRAERESGVAIDGEDLRRFFEDAARRRIVPAACARAARASLAGDRLRVALCGASWDSANSGETHVGPLPVFPQSLAWFTTTKVLVFPISDRRSVQAALDASAAGANVLLREGEVPFAEDYPQLAPVASLIPFYRNGDELRRSVRALMRPAVADPSACRTERWADTRTELCKELCTVLTRDHTVARRIHWMIEELRRRQGAVACGPS